MTGREELIDHLIAELPETEHTLTALLDSMAIRCGCKDRRRRLGKVLNPVLNCSTAMRPDVWPGPRPSFLVVVECSRCEAAWVWGRA